MFHLLFIRVFRLFLDWIWGPLRGHSPCSRGGSLEKDTRKNPNIFASSSFVDDLWLHETFVASQTQTLICQRFFGGSSVIPLTTRRGRQTPAAATAVSMETSFQCCSTVIVLQEKSYFTFSKYFSCLALTGVGFSGYFLFLFSSYSERFVVFQSWTGFMGRPNSPPLFVMNLIWTLDPDFRQNNY